MLSFVKSEALLQLVFAEMISHSLKETDAAESKASEIINYISLHLETATLKSTAEHFHMSPNYLTSYLRKTTSQSYGAIVSALRLSKAQHLLINTNISIDEISQLLGYSEPLSFQNMFKRNQGMTPLQFRRKNLRYE